MLKQCVFIHTCNVLFLFLECGAHIKGPFLPPRTAPSPSDLEILITCSCGLLNYKINIKFSRILKLINHIVIYKYLQLIGSVK